MVEGERAGVMLSTWTFGQVANAAGWPVLAAGGGALEAALAAAVAVEEDPEVDSVSVGGLPDRSGRVSVDASVMLSPAEAGAVCFVRGFANPSLLARAVMDRTIHTMLAGSGAEEFARQQGFVERGAAGGGAGADPLLTDEARRHWERFLVAEASRPPAERGAKLGTLPAMDVQQRYAVARRGHSLPEPSHDTVCILARDRRGVLAGVCTTSGLGFKLPGRVGDSPIIGHGLYVDPAVGAVSATGNGELVMSVCGSFLGVELMARGMEPLEALRGVLERIAQKHQIKPQHQVALIALRADGTWASAALRPGFSHCISTAAGTELAPAQGVILAEAPAV